ncbi:MAG: AI-2E family transporter [Nitrospirae bacterium]|nr:AI-2E family transporter [Nitrospirota bacterium]
MNNKPSNWTRILAVVACVSVLFYLMSVLADLTKILVVSGLLAYIMDPLAVKLESRGMSRTVATLIIFAALSVLLTGSLIMLLPAFVDQISAIQADLSPEQASALFARLDLFVEKKLSFIGIHNLELSEKLQRAMINFGDWMISHLIDVFSLFTHLVLIPFITFFLLKDGRAMKKQIIRIIPNRYFEFSLNLFSKMDSQLGNFLRGQFMDALIFGALAIAALWFLDVKYFLLIGLFAGAANLIPFVGPIAGALAAVTVSVVDTGSFAMAGYIVPAFVIMKLIDDALIQPIVVARSVDMHPLMVLMAVIIGGKFFGILGMLLSVPATGFFKVAVKESILLFRRYRLT